MSMTPSSGVDDKMVSSSNKDLNISRLTELRQSTELKKEGGGDPATDRDGVQDENAELKDLLLIHLDLIQQQSELLVTKDKTISDLQTENETLKQRLHRMERRVSLKSQNGHSQHKPIEPAGNPGTNLIPRRRSSVETVRVGRVERKKTRDVRDRNESPILRKLEKLTTTGSAYLTAVGETDVRWAGSSAADSVNSHSHLKTNSKATLEVPKWRTRPYTSSYTMEGTENLSDDVFDRRHLRLAFDEKRRKRWDVQRIREQRTIERLKEREERKKAAREVEVIGNPVSTDAPDPVLAARIRSFWPEPTVLAERLSLIVTDQVPVGAFGINFPRYSSPIEFSLPWLDGKEQPPIKHRKRGKR